MEVLGSGPGENVINWDEYTKAYEEMLENTSTDHAPWYIVPADYKWVARTLVASIITSTIGSLNLNTRVRVEKKGSY